MICPWTSWYMSTITGCWPSRHSKTCLALPSRFAWWERGQWVRVGLQSHWLTRTSSRQGREMMRNRYSVILVCIRADANRSNTIEERWHQRSACNRYYNKIRNGRCGLPDQFVHRLLAVPLLGVNLPCSTLMHILHKQELRNWLFLLKTVTRWPAWRLSKYLVWFFVPGYQDAR